MLPSLYNVGYILRRLGFDHCFVQGGLANMKLTSLFQQGLEATRYLERYVNNVRPGRHSFWSDTNSRFSPHEGVPLFEAPCLRLAENAAVTILKDSPDPLLESTVLSEGVLFVVHPDMLDDRAHTMLLGLSSPYTNKEHLNVTPTSSTRTLLTTGRDYNFFIKTDLNKRHYGFNRSLKRSGVKHSIAVSSELLNIARNNQNRGLAILPESIGVVIGGEHDSDSSGVIFRETQPQPRASDERILVPYFSLYANDMRSPSDEPLLIQLAKLHAPKNAEAEFFIEVIVGPLLRHWCYYVAQHGILLELHGQNSLIELDSRLWPQRVVVRDFQGLYLDPVIRQNRGLGLPSGLCLVGNESGITRPKHYSHLFDHLIGDLLLHRLTTTFTRHFEQYSYSFIAKRIADLVRAEIPEQLFSEDAYSFEKSIQDGRIVWTEATRRPPIFR